MNKRTEIKSPIAGEITAYLNPFINSIPGGFLMINEQGRIVSANNVCARMFGYDKKELLGMNLSNLLPDESRHIHSHHIKGFFNKPHSRPMGSGLELHGKKKNGDLFPIEVSLGSYTTDAGMFGMAFIVDISERVEAKKQLTMERSFIDTLIETVSALIVVQDVKGRIVRFNSMCEKVTGLKAENVLGKSLWITTLMPKDQIPISKEIFRKLIKSGEPIDNEIFWISKKNGKRLIHWSNTMLKNNLGEILYVIKTGIDITDSKNRERDLLNAVVEGQENERKRISRELHDGLAPLLSSVKNNLEVVAPVVEELAEKHRSYFNDSVNQINYAMDEVRTISKDLMPRTLEDFGLVSALRELCERLERTGKLNVTFYKSGITKRLPADMETGIYRVVQELVNNAIKHSRASRINVQLIKHKKSVVCTVEDNGRGFDVSKSQTKGLGLRNIESRVKSMNGFSNFDSRPGNGTSVTVEIQL
ncbi:MAG TPA: PAS domain S-box protein [Ignavibacteria bacterium]|nr:PAS domain S-box protein [Ignavibacteria bacterium]